MNTSSKSIRPATFHPVLDDNVYIAQNLLIPLDESFHCFSTDGMLKYLPLCDDFGPMNMSSVIRFIQLLDERMVSAPNSKMVYCAEEGRRGLTNAVFLLGAYMLIKLNSTTKDVLKRFEWLDPSQLESYRDATYATPDFGLTLQDCWGGLERGRDLGWVRAPTDDEAVWGRIDTEEYAHYDNPLNADLHEVVPGKFVAFKGPRDLGGGRDFLDDERGYRLFAAEYYLTIFRALGVSSVVRLNEPEYDAEAFEAHGIRHHEIEFEDCSAPPAAVAAEFLRIADGARAVVAVHCRAGLGRTGTLIALYMMRTHGFSGREAMGWLRIMRPGSVIGPQQHFLCTADAALSTASPPAPAAASPAAAAQQPDRPGSAADAGQIRPGDELRLVAADRSCCSHGGVDQGGAGVASASAGAAAAAAAAAAINTASAETAAAVATGGSFLRRGDAGAAACAVLAAQVAAGMERQAAARAQARLLTHIPPAGSA